jgi:hypothetical protein
MQESSRRVTQLSKTGILSLVSLSVVVAGSLLAYRFVFHRSGEEATTLIPSDAALVATLDVTPGPDQVVLFGRIARSLKMEAVQKPIEASITTSKNGTTFVEEVMPHLGASYAAAAWTRPGAKPTDEPAVVGLATVDNSATVEAIAAKHGALAHLGDLAYYSIKSEKICVAFVRDYLVVSNSPEALARVRAVSRGKAASVASLNAFQQARAKLPSSANLMMFADMASPLQWSRTLTTGSPESSTTVTMDVHTGDARHPLKGWATMATTLRDQGLDTVWRVPAEPGSPEAKLIDGIAPIDSKLYTRLPAGAYGVLAFSQPGAYYDAKDHAFGLTPEQRKDLNDGLNSFEKETGLDIAKDLIPGLKGNLTLAVYPGREAMTGVPDGLIMLDDANGADPAAMVDKIRSVIVTECKKNDLGAPKFRSEQRNGAVVWTLDEKSQSDLRDTVDLWRDSESDDSDSDTGKTGESKHRSTATAEEKKQILFATLGRSVVIVSSQSMLDRAITAYNTGASTLAMDSAYTPLLKRLTPGAQNLFLLAAPDVMARLRPTLAQQFTDPHGPKAEDVAKLFGKRGNGLVISQGHEGQTLTGNMFLPLDYEAAIHLMSLAKQANQHKGTP